MGILLWLLAIVLVLVGIAGTVIPGLPGPILVFGGLFLAAWADDFARVGAVTLTLLGALMIATYLVDFAASAAGAKRLGASRRAVVGAALGLLIGFFFGLPGLIVGPFLGAVLAELTVKQDLRLAGRAGLGAWLGLIVGMAAKLTLLFMMIGLFVLAMWLGR